MKLQSNHVVVELECLLLTGRAARELHGSFGQGERFAVPMKN